MDKTVIKNNKKFLVHSPDTFLSNMFINTCKEIYNDYTAEYCYDLESFSECVNRGSLFNENKRILILTELSDENIQDFIPLIGYGTDDVIILVEKASLKKGKDYVKVKASYTYVKIEELSEKECRDWLHAHMLKEGLKFATTIPLYIVKKRGPDLRALSNEVRKLKLLNKDVTEALCDEVVSTSGESDFFSFIDNFSHKRLEACLIDFYKVEESKYVSLLHFMLSFVERLYKTAIYREQKKSTDEVADLTGLPKFILQTKYYTVLSIFSKVKLLKMLDLLNELDFQLRVSKYSNTLLFETYILRIFKL